MGTFSKFARPESPRAGKITNRDLDIIEAILRYRFSPSSELLRLVGGNEDVTHRRLRRLWESGLINRFAFPFPRPHSAFYYYLDSRSALDLLANARGIQIYDEMLADIRNNREKDYAAAAVRGQHMQLGFLQHSLMISRMHFCIEMACRESPTVALLAWRQGGPLTGRKVELAKLKSMRKGNGNVWEETTEIERLPVEPDGVFSLRIAETATLERHAHFFYEADRGTMTMNDMLKKFRAYFHFIKRQQKHRDAFGLHPIRAVLIETTDAFRARRLMELVNHPLVCGSAKRTGLFWFTISTLLSSNNSEARTVAKYLERPGIVFDPIWALPDASLHALTDEENNAVS
jgi:hypothetical protein